MKKGKKYSTRVYRRLILAAVCLLAGVIGCTASAQKKIIEVPYLSQEKKAATGCELVSATMLLQYHGKKVTLEEMIQAVPKSELEETEKGLVGVHPASAFIGDPHSDTGFGCYAPVVVDTINQFLPQEEKKAVDLTGKDMQTLISDFIDRDRPVLLWATMNMTEPEPGDSWTLKDTGKKFQWIAGEHCLVLVGYDRSSYYFNDPYETKGVVSYPKKLVERRYQALGRQAVAILDSSGTSSW